MKIKNSLLLVIIAASIALFSSCTVNSPSVSTNTQTFALTQVATSTANVTISWPKSSSSTEYTICVYSDEKLANLLQSYVLSGDESQTPKFTIPFLDCINTFYITVADGDGKTSTPLTVSLEENLARRNIISQNFDKLCWGYDYINAANGIRLNNEIEQKLSTYTVDALADSYEDCHTVTKVSDEGGLLFACNNSLREMMGLGGWSGTKASVYIRPGYIKLGNAYTTSCKLASPTFSAIGADEKVEAEISLSACIYSASANSSTGSAKVAIIKADGSTLWSEDLFLEAVTDTPKWKNFNFLVSNVTSDCHFEVSIDSKTKQICFDDLKIVRKLSIPKNHIYGYVTDKGTGEPIPNVAISDGFKVVTTDQDGLFMMEPHRDSWYIYYSIPSDYKVTIDTNGMPKFHTARTADKKEYNFSLRKFEGGKEEKFALFTFADPQVSSTTGLNRFIKEAVPGIAKHAKTLDVPCYGITLGDVISNSSSKDATSFMVSMREAMNYKKIGMPVFQVMGNHDANWFNSSNPIEPDEKSSTFEVRAQRDFETTFGPINYSFNRGDFHIVGMRDIVYQVNNSMGSYAKGFLKEQYEWLKQDLAVVPKDKVVLLCVHIPLCQATGSTSFKLNYIKETFDLLAEFKEAHVISGHTHLQRNYEPSKEYPTIYEHNMGTVCGTWWTSNLCGDGTPNGYGVFVGEGAKFAEWYYMGYSKGMDSRNYQMRLYRGNAITGAAIVDNKNGQEGYYSFNFADNVILANVFNADSKWVIDVYENGEYSGRMTKITTKSVSFKTLVGSYTMSDPRQIKDGTVADYDMWTAGFHLGVLDRYSTSDKSPSNGSWNPSTHMYRYTLKNKDSKVKVVATDRFGYRYESEEFVDYRNNNLAQKP